MAQVSKEVTGHRSQVIGKKARRAMTLLEVVLAVTLLAAMSGLIATLWTQATRMSDDGNGQHRAMRLARVLEMLHSQWADRRTSVKLGKGGSSIEIAPDVLTFITATAVLEPGWPIVRARYVVERDYQTGVGVQSAWRLIYEELPIVDLNSPQGRPASSADSVARPLGAPREKRVVLLNGCHELNWQRFGRSELLESEDQPPNPEDTIEPATNSNSLTASKPKFTPTAEDKIPQWREIETTYRGRAPAIRLTGIFEEKEFSCVLIVGDSR